MSVLTLLTAGSVLIMLAPAVRADGYGHGHGHSSHGQGTACIVKVYF